MRDFLYPVQALKTVFDATSIARIDLAVFTSASDVTPNDINVKFDEKPDPRLEYLSEVVRWCWSNKAEVVFTDEAFEELLNKATELDMDFHCEEIPLVSIDMKWKLARLSIALAYLTLSTDDEFKKVVVEKEHVDYIADFIREEYEKAGLNQLALLEKTEIIDRDQAKAIIKRISSAVSIDEKKLMKIIEFIVMKNRVTKDQIKQRFGLLEKSELRPLLAELASEDLTKRGNGIHSTPKLIALYKLLINDEIAKNANITTLKNEPLQKNSNNVKRDSPLNSLGEINE